MNSCQEELEQLPDSSFEQNEKDWADSYLVALILEGRGLFL